MVVVGCIRCARETRAPRRVHHKRWSRVLWCGRPGCTDGLEPVIRAIRGSGGGDSRYHLGFQEGGGRVCSFRLVDAVRIREEQGDCWWEGLVDDFEGVVEVLAEGWFGGAGVGGGGPLMR